MKRLKQSEQVLMPANQTALPSMVIIITDPTAQHLPFTNSDIMSDLARYKHKSQPYKPLHYNPQPCNTYPRENRLRKLMRQERKLLTDTIDEFTAATKHLIETLVSWVIWRILLPLTVLSVLWMAFASPAELPL
jgi:hypothetical protein